ncbi:hypothetical protein [Streptomyces spirodelae]|uniref:Antitoxin Phd n=1 Tax=Streptomyces spirodelae TaxID=2812904 RepID=A0ABS3WXS9_9ACTN|nr:hypothetical protein [Streptomyces spirodelae]MBO8187940.1 hypothetical protein [Streptomyces spirodelae]
MPALNVVFSDEEMAEVREAANREGVSVKALAHDTVLSELRRRKVRAAALRTARISAGLNERLATK